MPVHRSTVPAISVYRCTGRDRNIGIQLQVYWSRGKEKTGRPVEKRYADQVQCRDGGERLLSGISPAVPTSGRV
jgi:hypothetical protein